MADINQAIMQARAQLGGPRGVRANPTMIPPRLQAFAAKHGMQAAQDRFAKFRGGQLPGQTDRTSGLTRGTSPFGPGSSTGETAVGGGLGGGNPMGGDGGMPAGGGVDYEGGPFPGGPPASGGIYAGGPTPGPQDRPVSLPFTPNPGGSPYMGMTELTGGGTRGTSPFGPGSATGETAVGGGLGGGNPMGGDGGAPMGSPPMFQTGGGLVGGPTKSPPWSPLGQGLGPPQIKGPPMRGPLPKKGGTKMKVQSGLGAMNNGALNGLS